MRYHNYDSLYSSSELHDDISDTINAAAKDRIYHLQCVNTGRSSYLCLCGSDPHVNWLDSGRSDARLLHVSTGIRSRSPDNDRSGHGDAEIFLRNFRFCFSMSDKLIRSCMRSHLGTLRLNKRLNPCRHYTPLAVILLCAIIPTFWRYV